jgi:hypothetical protein
VGLHRNRLREGGKRGLRPCRRPAHRRRCGPKCQGVIVDGITAEASAATAVVRAASGATTVVTLIEVGPTLPGAKVAIANFGPGANPVAIDFLDASGTRVGSAPFP